MAELSHSIGPLTRFCRSLTSCVQDADDLAQEALARALTRPPRLDRPLLPWLRRVARNVHVDRLRKGRRQVDADVEAVAVPSPAASRRPWATGLPTRVRQHLRPRDLAVLLLREALDLTVAETAAALGMSRANVRVVHHRALHRLQAPPPMSAERATKSLEAFRRWAAEHDVRCVRGLVKAVAGDPAAVSLPDREARLVWQWVIEEEGTEPFA